MYPIQSLSIGQSSDAQSAFSEIWPWILALFALIVVGGVVLFIVRRSIHSNNELSRDGFSLHDLRELHRTGQLNDKEYEQAKKALVGHITKPTEPVFSDNPPNEQKDSD